MDGSSRSPSRERAGAPSGRERLSVDRRGLGLAAEAIARRFLESRGLRIVAQNYRCRMGEIDIVAREGETLVFVEVRLRSHRGYGGAAESIDAAKRRRLLAAARHYLMRGRVDCPARFDALLLDRADDPTIDWRRDVLSA